jgi:hypothetical protein
MLETRRPKAGIPMIYVNHTFGQMEIRLFCAALVKKLAIPET